MNEQEITYCVLRNYETLPGRVGNDLDIWVKDSQREKFYGVVKRLASEFNYILDYAPRISLIGEGDYFLIRKDRKSYQTIHIDCWTNIHWKGLSYIDFSFVEKNIILHDKGFYILSHGVAEAIMLLKELLYHGKVKAKYKKIIKKFSISDEKTFFDSFNCFFSNKYSQFILENAQAGNWQILEKRTNRLRCSLLLRGLSNPFFQLKNWVNYFHGQFRRCFIASRGIFLVLLGPDGSGKSTTANNIIESEVKGLFQKKYYFHGHFSFLPELKKIVRFLKKDNRKVDSTVSMRLDNLKPFGIFRSMIYPLYYGVNYFLGHFFIWKEKARSGLIVFDRYFYDYFIQRQYTNCPRWLLNVVAAIIPKPDIIIYLKNKPEIIHSRKSELSIFEIKRQQKICEGLVKKFSNSFKVETLTIEKTIESIQEIIVNKMQERKRSVKK